MTAAAAPSLSTELNTFIRLRWNSLTLLTTANSTVSASGRIAMAAAT